MDLHLRHAAPTDDERAAVDALLGPPRSAWDGGERGDIRDAHTAAGGREAREQRHLLLPALRALQARVGWLSETGLDYVCARLNVPPADAWGVATFYALLSTSPRAPRVLHVCDDIACRCKGAAELIETLERTVGPAHSHAPHGDQVAIDPEGAVWMRSPCLGLCDHAPAAFVQEAGVEPREFLVGDAAAVILGEGEGSRSLRRSFDSLRSLRMTSNGAQLGMTSNGAQLGVTVDIPQRGDPALILLKRVGVVDPTAISAYRTTGGFDALRKAIEIGADAVIREVTDSKLLGRGGAAFPTGRKWDAVAKQPARTKYLICNADESEPGTFKDRVLLDGDPFAIVEAMTIAGFATGCERGFLYIRGEYPLGAERMQHAIDESREHGFLGADILGRGVRFDIEIRRGAGAYICGEETAIFNSIEGYRGEPRNKPPFPAQAGLFGLPTVVNNVETLANIPFIVLEGGAAFARIGTEQSAGPRLFCLSGHVTRPGVYEVPFGKTLRELIELAGGVANGRTLQTVLLGGAAGVFVGPDELDMPLTFEGVRAAKATLGSGVILLFDDTVNMSQILLRIASFFRDESCGQCVPCRVGTVRQEEALYRIASGKPLGGVAQEIALLDEVGLAMKDASICGLGQTAYSAIESAIHRVRVLGMT
ncbi:MAG: Respiratory-chain dehydrogenase domain 51 kDa subunit [Gemmatimonadetes bacterium]|nr:Respiratory-chain dehydrogenase domain 51 kDa subunit [Gemmatimonadota bacterium]